MVSVLHAGLGPPEGILELFPFRCAGVLRSATDESGA